MELVLGVCTLMETHCRARRMTLKDSIMSAPARPCSARTAHSAPRTLSGKGTDWALASTSCRTWTSTMWSFTACSSVCR